MTPSTENIRARLAKIKALADSGIPGERENAAHLLESLLKKYGLTEADLSTEETDDILLAYETEFEKTLCTQIVGFVTGSSKIPYAKLRKGKKKYLVIEATPVQAAEINTLWDHYLSAYRTSAHDHLLAFIHAHKIFPESSRVSRADLTKQELEDMLRAMKMADGITQSPAPKKRLPTNTRR